MTLSSSFPLRWFSIRRQNSPQLYQLAISTGSACSSGVEAPSHVLRAIQLPEDRIAGALRIGIGKFTTDDEIERAAEILIKNIKAIQLLMS